MFRYIFFISTTIEARLGVQLGNRFRDERFGTGMPSSDAGEQLLEEDLPTNLRSAFGLRERIAFKPNSLWFSYGSNLEKSYFERKMSNLGSSLTLIEPKKALLSGFQRTLDNESSRHGLGYEIHCRNAGRVKGVLHKVPLKDLPAFLRMEGVLEPSYVIKESPNYRVIEVALESEGKPVQALSLKGNKRCAGDRRKKQARNKCDELREYIEASLSGALEMGVDPTPFRRGLAWLMSIC